MEVDRISQMGGVGRDSNPPWQNSAKRRRKFVEEIQPPESEDDPPPEPEEAQEAPQEFSQWDTESAVEDREADASFRALA